MAGLSLSSSAIQAKIDEQYGSSEAEPIDPNQIDESDMGPRVTDEEWSGGNDGVSIGAPGGEEATAPAGGEKPAETDAAPAGEQPQGADLGVPDPQIELPPAPEGVDAATWAAALEQSTAAERERYRQVQAFATQQAQARAELERAQQAAQQQMAVAQQAALMQQQMQQQQAQQAPPMVPGAFDETATQLQELARVGRDEEALNWAAQNRPELIPSIIAAVSEVDPAQALVYQQQLTQQAVSQQVEQQVAAIAAPMRQMQTKTAREIAFGSFVGKNPWAQPLMPQIGASVMAWGQEQQARAARGLQPQQLDWTDAEAVESFIGERATILLGQMQLQQMSRGGGQAGGAVLAPGSAPVAAAPGQLSDAGRQARLNAHTETSGTRGAPRAPLGSMDEQVGQLKQRLAKQNKRRNQL